MGSRACSAGRSGLIDGRAGAAGTGLDRLATKSSSSRCADAGGSAMGGGATVTGPDGGKPAAASRPYKARLGSGANPGSGTAGSGPRDARSTKGAGDLVTYTATTAAITNPSNRPTTTPKSVPPY